MDSDLNPEIRALRSQVFTLLVALVVIAGTLAVYLFRQASSEGKDIAAIKPEAQQVIAAYNKNQAVITSFVNQLVVYGETHPDFRPVLAKYNLGTARTPAK
jgi:hypothetical protein